MEDQRLAGVPESDSEPHHRLRAAGRLPALCILCLRGQVSGTGEGLGDTAINLYKIIMTKEDLYTPRVCVCACVCVGGFIYYVSVFICSHLFFLSSGWRLCPLRDLHHPVVHTPQLVWNLLQVSCLSNEHCRCSLSQTCQSKCDFSSLVE